MLPMTDCLGCLYSTGQLTRVPTLHYDFYCHHETWRRMTGEPRRVGSSDARPVWCPTRGEINGCDQTAKEDDL